MLSFNPAPEAMQMINVEFEQNPSPEAMQIINTALEHIKRTILSERSK
jgi:hypothetical protein